VTSQPRSADAVRLSSVLSLFAIGLMLRPQIVGIGPLQARMQSSLGISHAVAGLVVTIPVLCMGMFAPFASRLQRRYGRSATSTALLLIGIAGVVRAVVPGAALVLLVTVPIGIGIALAGTLLPVLVKEEYVNAPTLGTGVYATGINVGATIAALTAAALAAAIGWRGVLAVYSAVSIVLVLPWVFGRRQVAEPLEPARLPVRSPVAWAIVATFALQSVLFYGLNAWLADAYVERGWSQGSAGALVAVANAVSLVTGIVAALGAHRFTSRRIFLVSAAVLSLLATTFFALDLPSAWVWAAAAGASFGILFTTVMVLPLDAGATRGEVAAVTSLMLGVGYVFSALAPLLLGAVRDATGSFKAPLALLAVDAFVLLVVSTALSPRRVKALGGFASQ